MLTYQRVIKYNNRWIENKVATQVILDWQGNNDWEEQPHDNN